MYFLQMLTVVVVLEGPSANFLSVLMAGQDQEVVRQSNCQNKNLKVYRYHPSAIKSLIATFLFETLKC